MVESLEELLSRTDTPSLTDEQRGEAEAWLWGQRALPDDPVSIDSIEQGQSALTLIEVLVEKTSDEALEDELIAMGGDLASELHVAGELPGTKPAEEWARLVRRYLAYRETETLMKAREAAEDQSRIRNLLVWFYEKDLESWPEWTEGFLRQLWFQREAEAVLTLEVLVLDARIEAALQGESKKAVAEFAKQATRRATQLGDPAVSGYYLSLLGDTLPDLGRAEEALSAYDEALDWYQKLEGKASEHFFKKASTHYNRGNALRKLGREEKAISDYDEALELLSGQEEEALELKSKVLNNRGATLWKLNRAEQALSDFEGALRRYLKLEQKAPERFSADVADAYNNRGNALRKLGRGEKAISDFNEALRRFSEMKGKSLERFAVKVAALHMNRGLVLAELDRLEEALPDFDEALRRFLELEEKIPERFVGAVGSAYLNRGLVLWELGRLEEAIEALNEALQRRLKEAPAEEVAAVYNARGIVLTELDREEALSAFDQALQYLSDLGKERAELEAKIHGNRGAALQELSRLEEALEAYDKALKIYLELEERSPERFAENVAMVHYNRGTVLQRLGREGEAENAYKDAIRRGKRAEEALGDGGLASLRGLLEARRALGELYLEAGCFLEAYKQWSEVLEAVDSHRGQMALSADRARLIEEHGDLFRRVVDLYLKLADERDGERGLWATRAWHWAERSKNRELLERFEGEAPPIEDEEARQVYEELQEAERRLSALLDQVFGEGSGPQAGRAWTEWGQPTFPEAEEKHIKALKERASETHAEVQRLENRFERLTREREAPFRGADVPGVEEMAKRLADRYDDRRTLLIEYALLGDGDYAVFALPLWKVQEGESPSVRAVRAGLSEEALPEIEEQYGTFLQAVQEASSLRLRRQKCSGTPTPETKKPPRKIREAFRGLPEALSEVLLEPWWEEVMGRFEEPPARLIFVPGGPVHQLPLHLAHVPGTTTYLRDLRPVVVLPSAHLGTALAGQDLPGSIGQEALDLLAMGPPTGSGLPEADSEVDRLAERYGAVESYQGEEMTKERLRQKASAARIVHLATHSQIDPVLLQSTIKFSEEDLTLRELYSEEGFNFGAVALFYLSSCESGRPRFEQGVEELAGLAWGVMARGARSVLGSLWPVEDQSSRLFAEGFHRAIREEGASLAEAVQAGTQEVREEGFEHPFFWGPQVLYGQGELRPGELLK